MFWVVQATVSGHQIPTFFLDGDIQGILNEDTARKVARDVIDPLHVHDVSIFTEPAVKQPQTPRPKRVKRRSARDQAYSDAGLTKVKGALGTTSWE